jgi:glycerophosphoryl diester phosphodiesterase
VGTPFARGCAEKEHPDTWHIEIRLIRMANARPEKRACHPLLTSLSYHHHMRLTRRQYLGSLSAVPLLPLAARSPHSNLLVHGHRGARARRPENTLPAFQYAIEQGVDVLEMDLAVTKDGVLVVSHDPHINATICTGPHVGAAIHELTLAELRDYDCGSLRNPHFSEQVPVPGTHIPTFDEVLQLAAPSKLELNVETKIFADHPELTPSPERFVDLILEAIRRRHIESRIILQSFDFRTLHAMHRIAPEIRLSALWEGKPRSFVDIAKDAAATIVSPQFSLVTPELVAGAHATGVQVVPWTANDPKDWDKLVAARVDAIISDDPATLLAYLRVKDLHN